MTDLTKLDKRTFRCNGCKLNCFFTNDHRFNCPECGLIRNLSDGYKCRDCRFECQVLAIKKDGSS